MAVPLNTFKTTTKVIPEGPLLVMKMLCIPFPNGITAIVLMAQVANIDTAEHTVTFTHYHNEDSLTTELAKDFPIYPNDAAGLLTGKLIVEQGNKIRCSVSPGSGSNMKLVLSYLESLNG